MQSFLFPKHLLVSKKPGFTQSPELKYSAVDLHQECFQSLVTLQWLCLSVIPLE